LVEEAEIHKKAQSSKIHDRIEAANQLRDNFPILPDKKQAWEDLYRLLHDEDSVRWRATIALTVAFPLIPDKNRAWEELILLTKDKNDTVKHNAAFALGEAFSYVPDKKRAWEDLHSFTQHKNSVMRLNAADAIGASFPQIPDKKQAWDDLYLLAKDADSGVRISADYSMGRASIFNATEAKSEEKFKRELEKALRFFKKSSTEATFESPARFCHLFYKSFYTIIFKKQKAVVDKYLEEARLAAKQSESKEILLETIEYLAKALKEAQKAQKISLADIKFDLNESRQYCERAADLLETTKEKAPLATEIIKRGLPMIDEKIKQLLNDIDKRATILCDISRGTEAEKYTNPICQQVKKLVKIRNRVELEKCIEGITHNLKSLGEKLSETEKSFVYDKIETLRKKEYLEDKLGQINEIIVFIIPHVNISKKLEEILISLKPGIREELTITVGTEFLGTGVQHVITIPIQEIAYPDLKKDLEKINGRGVLKLTSLPAKLAEKVKGYLRRNKRDELQLTG
jgi:HEAT repeat protein